ncbi:hypothetical protein ABZP36_010671 [Zizania latifolia]
MLKQPIYFPFCMAGTGSMELLKQEQVLVMFSFFIFLLLDYSLFMDNVFDPNDQFFPFCREGKGIGLFVSKTNSPPTNHPTETILFPFFARDTSSQEREV